MEGREGERGEKERGGEGKVGEGKGGNERGGERLRSARSGLGKPDTWCEEE